MIRSVLLVAVGLLLAACAAPQRRPEPGPGVPRPPDGGGLYAPEIRDGGPPVPPDISAIPEPVPRPEPRSRYGNRSPYTVLGRSYTVLPSAAGYRERGIASWYGSKFHGRATSSLEPYDMYRFTAAHKTLPLPSYVRVTNLDNGRSVVVRVNDRGPFRDDRLIDLSYAAAVKLGIHQSGTAPVEVVALDGSEPALPAVAEPDVPTPTDGGRAWLQVGSFAQRDNAYRLRDRLRAGGVPEVRVYRARVDGERVWRVRVGPLYSIDAERRLLEILRALGFPHPKRVSR